MKEKISALLCAVTALYTVWYMHFEKPWTNNGALSTIGLTHHTFFMIWGILTYLSLSFGIILAYRRLLKTRLYLPFLMIAGIGMAMTLIFYFDYDLKPDYYLHCIGSMTFSIMMGTSIFLLFLLSKKRIFATLTAVILLADTICLIIFKETGLIETIPIFAGYIMLCITNLRTEKVYASR